MIQNVVTPYAVQVVTRSVVTPYAVQVVTQKDADRSVEANLRYEMDWPVVTPHAARVVTRSVVIPYGVQRVTAQRLVVTRKDADRKSVARIGFQSVAQPVARSARADHPIPPPAVQLHQN